MVITSRGTVEEGHHEFLMPSPTVWKRIRRSEPEMIRQPADDRPPVDGRTLLSGLSGRHSDIDSFQIPHHDDHPLWDPTVLPRVLAAAAWDDYAARLAQVSDEEWSRHHSGAILSWPHCQDWPAFQHAIDRVYVHLRNRAVPLHGANVTYPELQRRSRSSVAPFERGEAHLRVYLRLDHGDGEDCVLEFAEGGTLPVPAGGLLIASGARRHRLIGASLVLHFQIDLPAIARVEALALRGLRHPDVLDSIVFAAITAQPVSMPLPQAPVLFRKIEWLEGQRRRRQRNTSCPAVRRFLLQHADPRSASDEEQALIRGHGLAGGTDPGNDGQIIAHEAALSVDQCETLRRFAEAHVTSVVPDTVDDLPEFQVDLTVDVLTGLLGRDSVAALLDLPAALGAPPGEIVEKIDIFLRVYSPETRPFIAFHADTCAYTVNIALNNNDDFDGGRLLALHGGTLKELPRHPGSAILHAGNVVHGVSRIERGTRYSLILFFHRRVTPVEAVS